jgi:hypothetical protein
LVTSRAMSELPPSTTTVWGCPNAFSMMPTFELVQADGRDRW